MDKGGSNPTLTYVQGAHSGTTWTTWTTWVTPTSSGARADLTYLGTCTTQCTPTCHCVCGTNTAHTGAVVESYECRRHTSGTTPYWTPLRFPGQYHDEETDLNQNWNRFYDPGSGYLEAEPFYSSSPEYLLVVSGDDKVVSIYGYAFDNPLNFLDRNGRQAIPGTGSAQGVVILANGEVGTLSGAAAESADAAAKAAATATAAAAGAATAAAMAKGGKDKGENEWTRWAKATAQALSKTPCEVLNEAMPNASDPATKQKIKEA